MGVPLQTRWSRAATPPPTIMSIGLNASGWTIWQPKVINADQHEGIDPPDPADVNSNGSATLSSEPASTDSRRSHPARHAKRCVLMSVRVRARTACSTSPVSRRRNDSERFPMRSVASFIISGHASRRLSGAMRDVYPRTELRKVSITDLRSRHVLAQLDSPSRQVGGRQIQLIERADVPESREGCGRVVADPGYQLANQSGSRAECSASRVSRRHNENERLGPPIVMESEISGSSDFKRVWSCRRCSNRVGRRGAETAAYGGGTGGTRTLPVSLFLPDC